MACSRSHSRYLKKNLLAVSTCVILNNQWAHATNWSFRLYSLRRNRFVPKLRYLTHKANTTAFRTTNTTVRALSRCLPQLSLGISTSRNDPVPRRERMHQSCSPTQWHPPDPAVSNPLATDARKHSSASIRNDKLTRTPSRPLRYKPRKRNHRLRRTSLSNE